MYACSSKTAFIHIRFDPDILALPCRHDIYLLFCKNMTRESRAIVCLSSLRLFADYFFRPSTFVCQKLNPLILSIPVLSKCSKVNNVIQFTTRR